MGLRVLGLVNLGFRVHGPDLGGLGLLQQSRFVTCTPSLHHPDVSLMHLRETLFVMHRYGKVDGQILHDIVLYTYIYIHMCISTCMYISVADSISTVCFYPGALTL